jgi:hypothetical protein
VVVVKTDIPLIQSWIWSVQIGAGGRKKLIATIKTTNYQKTELQLTPTTAQSPMEQDDATKDIKM